MTDDPQDGEQAEADPFRMGDEALRWRTERTRQRLERMSDHELIGEVSGQPAPHVINPIELNRRLKESVKELTAELNEFRTSSEKQTRWLLRFTVVLVILTLALVVLTIELIIRAH